MALNIPCKKSRTSCFFLVLLSSVLCIVTTSAELQRFEHPTKEDGSLSFLVLGDWGRRGEFNQSEVAFQMGRVGEKLDIDFVVSTGDNFYDNGLSSEHDTAFEESFTKIYTQKSLLKQWYSILGNHDYRGDAEAQLSPLLRKIDSRWLCLRSFIVDAELADILFVDTTPFVNMYFTSTEDHTYDWRGIPSRKAYIQTLLKDVELALKMSSAKWKIVVGHHAIRSIGHHGDTQELIKHLLPILQANDVDFYMNGHDHCLEHISDIKSGIQFLTSGAGSKAWRGDMKNEEGLNKQGQLVNFFYDGQGFMSVQLNPTRAEIAFYDVFGNVIHSWTTSKLLHPSI
ncbi:purple acid phosphatase 17-like [Rosa rugosa]|uniref:purple acid phosphatase 17-like n=1 Tax=Rosa rugosa TaxID=74645 RepID=UPI002B408C59|nr:purple acid phosphatase 17-like [Rosa rugosa]